MSGAEFFGARLERDIIKMIENTAEEERVDKTKALKELVILGRKHFLTRKFLEMYRTGKCSIDKAAESTGITISEMMDEAAKAGIKSSETVEDYRTGLELLRKSKP
jgi:predicted HTH domain antitoxin